MMVGQGGESMMNQINRLDSERALLLFADWTDRIAAGELPATKPSRPEGVERNAVVSVWEWSSAKAYLHDEIATDKRNPTINGYGKLYGAPEYSTDMIPVLDPIRNKATEMKMPVRDPKTPSSKEDPIYRPSLIWGEERLWDSQATVHNPMLDDKGRVWFTSRIRPSDNPAFCKKGSEHPSAKLTPVNSSGRQLACTIRRARNLHWSIPATARTIWSLPRMLTIRFGPVAAAVPGWSGGSTLRCCWRLATRRSHRAGQRSSWTPTATASAMSMSDRRNLSIRRKTNNSK